MDNAMCITQDRMDEIIRLCKQSPVNGFIAELGVYQGGVIKNLAQVFPERKIIGFDTFAGLPKEHWNEEEPCKPNMFAASYDSVYQYIYGEGKNKNVKLIQGLFPGTADELKNEIFSFAHIDADFYEGTRSAIEFFYPRLIKGGIMVFDDYDWHLCPGVNRALNESGLKYERTNARWQAYLIKE